MVANHVLKSVSWMALAVGVAAIAAPAGAQSGATGAAAPSPPPATDTPLTTPNSAPDGSAADAASHEGDIVVTAQFRAQRLQDTPVAITAVNAEMLEARGQTNIAEVAAQAPNVNLQPAPSTYGPSVQAFIRGIGQSDSSFALEPGVGFYVDDVYYSTLLGSLLDLLDLDRVEILRGPQGTLAGQNSIGGAIKLYSKKPGENSGGYLQATYGRFNRAALRGAAGFTIVPGQLYARVSGTAVHEDGYVTRYDYRCTHPGSSVPSFQSGSSCKLGTEGGKDYQAMRGTLRWTPSPDAEFIVIGDYTKDESEAAPATLLYVGSYAGPGVASSPVYSLGGVGLGTASGSPFISYSPFGNYAQDSYVRSPYVSYENYLNSSPRDGTAPYSVPAKNRLDTWGVSGQANVHLSDSISITSITAYRHYHSVYASGDATPLNITLNLNDVTHWQLSEELRANARIADLLDLTVGGYYFKQHSNGGNRVQLPTLEFSQLDRVRQRTQALFANADVHVTPKLDLIGGIRYTDLVNNFTYGRLGNPGSIYGGVAPPSLAPLNGLKVPFSDTRFDYRAVAQYRWSSALMSYAQFSTGFRSGGANPRPFFPAQAIDHNPETLEAYEVGFKSDFLDRRVRLNGSAFYNRYKDILVTVSTCPTVPAAPCALPLNAGSADVKGLELEATVKPVAGLLIDGSLSYLHFRYKSLSALAVQAGLTLDQEGPFVQKWRWSIGAQYAADLGDLGTLTPRIDVTHQSHYFANPVNRPPFNELPARTIANARLTYRVPGDTWEAALEVTNLTDKLYYDGVFDNRASTSFVQGRPGRPREWALSVKRTF